MFKKLYRQAAINEAPGGCRRPAEADRSDLLPRQVSKVMDFEPFLGVHHTRFLTTSRLVHQSRLLRHS